MNYMIVAIVSLAFGVLTAVLIIMAAVIIFRPSNKDKDPFEGI